MLPAADLDSRDDVPMAGPLDGYRIIDFSQVVSGPLAAMVLADQGADVIKVEPTAGGDLTRVTGSPIGGITGFFANHNRGKRSVAVDLGTPEGLEFVLRLCDTADVVIQNFRPGVMDRLGVGGEAMLARNPDLIYVNISGYGATGPYSDRRVYDPVIQGVTGHVAAQLNPEIPFSDVHRTIVADKSTAFTAAQAITAALLARERGRARGQIIDIAMIDAALAFFWSDGMMDQTMLDDPLLGRRGTLAQAMRVTRCATGELIYFVASDKERHGLYRALGRPEWCEHPQWGTLAVLVKPGNFQALGVALEEEFQKWDADELLDRMLAEDVPCGPVHTFETLVDDPQLRHNNAIWEWTHPTGGRMRQARPAPHFGATPIEAVASAPVLGEHTDEVATELGYDRAALAALRASGVLA
jgi:crotonobetainyl-CoA:carnitine CoA-transferase CaiB-like acyl-CoA transferase